MSIFHQIYIESWILNMFKYTSTINNKKILLLQCFLQGTLGKRFSFCFHTDSQVKRIFQHQISTYYVICQQYSIVQHCKTLTSFVRLWWFCLFVVLFLPLCQWCITAIPRILYRNTHKHLESLSGELSLVLQHVWLRTSSKLSLNWSEYWNRFFLLAKTTVNLKSTA